ncbi:hypothetical protein BDQ17DRAFT_1549982 [Cyathus striatus]|nr:hypothetical protein BDQ17DRAFT_1549982 [Cyathus striatus]
MIRVLCSAPGNLTHVRKELDESMADAPPSRRRNRGSTSRSTSDTKPVSNYFTLKAKLEQDNAESNWDGSVRGYRGKERRRSMYGESAAGSVTGAGAGTGCESPNPLAVLWDRPPPSRTPLDTLAYCDPLVVRTNEFDYNEVGPGTTGMILATKWHEYSNETLQSGIANVSKPESPSQAGNHPYHTTIRVLSSALENLTRVRRELEESRMLLLDKEASRRARAEELFKELPSSEVDTARRVIQSIFTDDDEDLHQVKRKQSAMSR